MKEKLNALFQSRRFWVAVAGVVTVVGSEVFKVELNQEQIIILGTIVATWILGDSLRPTEKVGK